MVYRGLTYNFQGMPKIKTKPKTKQNKKQNKTKKEKVALECSSLIKF